MVDNLAEKVDKCPLPQLVRKAMVKITGWTSVVGLVAKLRQLVHRMQYANFANTAGEECCGRGGRQVRANTCWSMS